MLNEKKVILMTKMALLESKEQESLQVNRFRRRDYIWVHVLKMVLAITTAFLLVAGIGAFVLIQKAEDAVRIDRIPVFLIGAAVVYVICIGLNVAFTWWIYGRRYDRKKKEADRFVKYVAHLDRYYEKESGNE